MTFSSSSGYSSSAAAVCAPASSPTSAKSSRVLLIDDHPITRQGMRALLEQSPSLTVCGEAENGDQALDMVANARPDVIVVDISLPNRNGIQLTRELKSRVPEVPVLVLSMHDENIYAEKALRAGANGYLMKQEAGDKVVAAIQKVLQGDIFLSPRVRDRIACNFVPKRRHMAAFPIDTLSEREREVFLLIGEGFSTRQISRKLELSSKTIDSYREHLKFKLGLKSGAALVHHAIQWGWTKEPA